MKILYPLPIHRTIFNDYGPRQSFQLPDGRWTLPFHYGADFVAPEGTPIQAGQAGTVKVNSWDHSGYGGGNQLALDIGGGYTLWFLHLQRKPNLKIGQRVTPTTIIGRVGNTGASTGPHLHQELHLNGVPINPAPFYVTSFPREGYSMSSYTLKKPVAVSPGKLKRLPHNSKGTVSVKSNKPYYTTAGVYITGGQPGDGTQLVLIKDTYDPKTNKAVKSAVARRVSAVFDHRGQARIQLSGIVEPQRNVRWRFASQNDGRKAYNITRTTLDQIEL